MQRVKQCIIIFTVLALITISAYVIFTPSKTAHIFGEKSYVVKRGDTLYSIAAGQPCVGKTVRIDEYIMLVKTGNKLGDEIYPGQELILPVYEEYN